MSAFAPKSRAGQWHEHGRNAAGVVLQKADIAERYTNSQQHPQHGRSKKQRHRDTTPRADVVALPSILERIAPRPPTAEQKDDGSPREPELAAPLREPEPEPEPEPPKRTFKVFRRHHVEEKPEPEPPVAQPPNPLLGLADELADELADFLGGEEPPEEAPEQAEGAKKKKRKNRVKKERRGAAKADISEQWLQKLLSTDSDDGASAGGKSKLAFDRDSLRANGLADAEIDRLFRAMYVYTIGFQEMIEDVAGKKAVKSDGTADPAPNRARIVGSVLLAWNRVTETLQDVEFSTDIGDVMRENENTRKALLALQQELQASHEAHEALNKDLDGARAFGSETEDKLHAQLQAVDELQGLLAQAAEKQAQMQSDAVGMQRNIDDQAEEISGLYGKVRTLSDTIEDKEKELEALEKKLKAKEHSGKMAVLAVQADLDTEKSERKQEVENMKVSLDRATERADVAERSLAQATKQRDETVAELEASKARVIELEAELEVRVGTLEKQLAQMESRCEAAEQSEKELGEEMQKLQEQQKLMTQVIEERDAALLERDAVAAELEAVTA
jgi:hypothetical protein